MNQSFRLMLVFVVSIIFSLAAQQIQVTGEQSSQIQYRLEQDIQLFTGIKELVVSFVVPRNFNSPTYRQGIRNVRFNFTPSPTRQEENADERGNLIRTFYWENPADNVTAEVTFQANNRVNLKPLIPENASFPIPSLPEAMRVFLTSTKQVPADDPEIQQKAAELTRNARTVYQATRKVLNWVSEYMHYALVPEQYDALYAFHSGKGNCQNYSHLAAALLRAVGIPVRIVNGITLDKPYSFAVGESQYQFGMAQGRHSWIEVYFPDAGWIPFDPQQSEFFVSNRYLRVEVGIDNEETVNDGLVRWRQSRGTKPQSPKLEEAIASEFVRDAVNFQGEIADTMLTKILLTPPIVAARPPIAALTPSEQPAEEKQKEPAEPAPEPEPKPKPKKSPPAKPAEPVDYTQLTYDQPFVYGNLDFPEGVNFAFPRASEKPGRNRLTRSFLVETAEYVTAKRQFAQVFELDRPIKLESIALALHNFGGSGDIWLELSEDAGGQPGATAVKSGRIRVQYLNTGQGYRWVDFDFSREGVILSPGKYWIFLNFSGGPIVNWFYSYGKPVGPANGTRSRAIGEREWNTIHAFEFNYRVKGKAARE